MSALAFAPPPASPQAETLRGEVRAFLATALADRPAAKRAQSWSGFDPAFSRKIAEQGWIGMTFPREYGGHGRSALERYVVLEEMLAAGAPVSAHWIADRQSGPAILRFGTEEQKRHFLPRIARGEHFFCIGMSEPDSGSDLASVRTRAVPVEGGFRVNGTKVWTSHAHEVHTMILFCRTSGAPEDRHGGTSQLLVDLKTPGITIRPIYALTGQHHFNEVVFQDAFLPADAVLGNLDDGWNQVTSELANERSGPERFLSSFTLLVELLRAPRPGAVGARGNRRRPPRLAPRRFAPVVALSGRHAAGRREPGLAGGAGERPRHDAGAGNSGDRASADLHRSAGAGDRAFRGRAAGTR